MKKGTQAHFLWNEKEMRMYGMAIRPAMILTSLIAASAPPDASPGQEGGGTFRQSLSPDSNSAKVIVPFVKLSSARIWEILV